MGIWFEVSKSQVKQTLLQNRAALVAALIKEVEVKKQKMDTEYAEKLKAIDASISKKIEEQAILKGYDVVLSKGIVLYGGKDITNEVIKAVK